MSMDRDVSREKVSRVSTRVVLLSAEAPENDGDDPDKYGEPYEGVTEDLNEGIDWYISTNYYNANILNARNVFIADIDIEEYSTDPLLRSKEAYMEWFTSFIVKQIHRRFRVYETANGFRVFLVDSQLAPDEYASTQLMKLLRSDPLYASCCVGQMTYRARLSPKPMRIGMTEWEGQQVEQFFGLTVDRYTKEEWEAVYNERSKEYAVAKVAYVDKGVIEDAVINQVIQIHDEHCLGDGKPLA